MTMTLAQKIRRNLYLKQYLAELEILLGRSISQENLGSLELVNALRKNAEEFAKQLPTTCEVNFSEKKTDRFKKYIQKLTSANSSAIYIWTPRTVDCGAVLVSSLQDIKFDFDFSIHEEGILVFITDDFCDQLLLDFFESPVGVPRLKIETKGKHWASIQLNE